MKIRAVIICLSFISLFPLSASALTVTDIVQNSPDAAGITAQSFTVLDKKTGNEILSKDSSLVWVPASLTKLVTALVVLDTKPNLNAQVTMQADDEVGGARISTQTGVKYRVKDIFYATLVASANNAAVALSRSTGLPREQFVERMNKKAGELGAAQTHFNEPSGMDEHNTTSASDYAKIAAAAFNNPFIRQIAKTQRYTFRSSGGKKLTHTIKSTNKLLGDRELQMVAGKTGYLDESKNNFVSEAKDKNGNDFIVVVMGSRNVAAQFQETKQLMRLGALVKDMGLKEPVVFAPSAPLILAAN